MQFVQIHGKSNSDNEYQVASFNDIATVFPFSPSTPPSILHFSQCVTIQIYNEWISSLWGRQSRVLHCPYILCTEGWKVFLSLSPSLLLSKAMFGTNWMHKIQLPNTNIGFFFYLVGDSIFVCFVCSFLCLDMVTWFPRQHKAKLWVACVHSVVYWWLPCLCLSLFQILVEFISKIKEQTNGKPTR